MKKIAIISIMLIFILISCFSPWTGANGKEGTLTINLGGGKSSRAAVLPAEQTQLGYTITLTGSGEPIRETFRAGTTSTTLRVQPGTYDITVEGRKSDNSLRAFGERAYAIEGGKDNQASIEMFPASEANDAQSLQNAITNARDNGKEIVFITGNIDDISTINPANIFVGNNKIIELRAKEEVFIKREITNTAVLIDIATGGTLILGKENEKTKNLIIDGNGTTSAGAPLIQVGGTLILNDAVIRGNKSVRGLNEPGVYVNGGRFEMYGGEISNNIGNQEGGGVKISAGGTFEMYDGTISGNEAADRGGAVFFEDGTFTMRNGSISANKAGFFGGGVYVSADQIFNMYGGVIEGDGNPSSIEAFEGGGVYIDDNSTFNMFNDAKIINNNVLGNGGGVYSYHANFYILTGSTALIEHNTTTANGSGGGVYIEFDSTDGQTSNFNMDSGFIRSNTANSGGGVYINNQSSEDGHNIVAGMYAVDTGIYGNIPANSQFEIIPAP